MSKVSATYNAPEDDSAVVTMGGVRFFDGQAAKLDTDKDALLLSKLRTNQHFKVVDKTTEKEPAKETLKPTKPDHVFTVSENDDGEFSILDGKKVVKEGLSKEDADVFEALSDEDKAEYVK